MPETWTAADGTVVTIRPIDASDLALEQAFVDGLSTRTGYLRLMSGRRPSAEEIRHFTDVDPEREVAFIATVSTPGGEHQIGVARYVKEPEPGTADFAIVLSDDWQGRGLGSRLLRSLFAAAKREGLQQLVGTTLWENRGMIALALKLGFRVARDPDSAAHRRLVLDLATYREAG